MKNIVFLLISFFVLVGCAPKTVVTVQQEPAKEVKIEPKEEPEIIVEEESENVVEEEPENVVEEKINKIAILYPSKIVGKYAKSTIGTISAYLIYNNKEFELETFDSYDEDGINILEQIGFIEEKGFSKVIALFTENGFDTLNMQESLNSMKIYFPLINKNEIITNNDNFIFGGISYEDQMNLLSKFSADKKTMFYYESYTGNKLKNYFEKSFGDKDAIIKKIKRRNNKYKYIMDDERIIGNTIVLNTDIIESSIILSQLTAYEIEPANILSTQLNYKKSLLQLTQPRHRTNLFVVNSIGNVDDFLADHTKTLGADISYNWVDYSSLVGVDYLLSRKEKTSSSFDTYEETTFVNDEVIEDSMDNEKSNEIQIREKSKILNNQVVYEPVLYRGTFYGFEKVESTLD